MALGFDLSREELETYQGTNPRPDDFNEFWDAALMEMNGVDPQVEIIPAEEFQVPFADCSHLWFTGVGGARVHAKLLQPKNDSTPHPAVLQFHGYGGASGDWNEKLNYVAAGHTVVAMDCRGQGGLSEDAGGVKGTTANGHIIRGLDDAPEKLLYRSIFLDTVQLANIVMGMPGVDEARVGAMGGSQGGALTLVCAALEPRIRRVAAIHPFLCDYQRVWDMEQAKDAYFELRDFFRRHDPRHEREEEIFRRLGYIDVQHLAPRVQAEVLFASSFDDTICPPSTQFAAYNKISSKKSMIVYPDYGHEWLPGFLDEAYQFMLGL